MIRHYHERMQLISMQLAIPMEQASHHTLCDFWTPEK